MTSYSSLAHYTPPRKKYQVKGDSWILGKISTAKDLRAAAASISGLGEQVEASQGSFTSTVDQLVKLFTGHHNLGFPEGKRYVNFDAKSAKAPDIIFRMMGMLLAPIRYEYISPAGVAREKDADEIELWLNAFPGWHHRKYPRRYDIANRFWQLLAGKSYIRQSFLPFYWDKNELRRQSNEQDADYNRRVEGYRGYMGPPVFRESLDPRLVLPLDTPMGNAGYLLHYRVQAFELRDKFRGVGKDLVINPRTNKVEDVREFKGVNLPMQSDEPIGSGSCEYWEFHDDTYCYYVVDDKVVHKYNHGGNNIIVPGYALQTGFSEFALNAVGMLWAVRNELPQYDFMRTLMMNAAYLQVFPQLFARLAADEDPIRDEHGAPTNWNIEPMTVKQIRGELVNALKDATSGVDFRAALENLSSDIDLATIPNLARGFAGAQQPGYSINQLSQTIRTHWKAPIESAELQESILAEHLIKTNKREGKPWTVYAQLQDEQTGRKLGKFLVLDPEKVEPYARVQANLSPELPIDKQGNMLTMWKLHVEGGMPFEDYWRDGVGETNPVAARKKIIRDAGIRAMLPEIFKAAQALGNVKLTNELIEQRGADKLNAIGTMDVQRLKADRAAAQEQATMAAAGGGMAPPSGDTGTTPTGGPPGAPGPVDQTTAGIAPTAGANPNNPSPGFRGGS